MNVKTIITGFFLILGIWGCNKENEQKNLTNTFSISYKKDSLMAKNSFKATIDQNGLLQIFEKRGLNNFNRNSEYHISESDLSIFKADLIKVSLIDINDKYGSEDTNSFTSIRYNIGNKSDSASIYFKGDYQIPMELETILNNVKMIVLKYDTLFYKEIENESNTFSVSYTKISSWFDSYLKITINQNGILHIFEQLKLNDSSRINDYQINDSELVLLKENLKSVSLINIYDKYGFGDNMPTDLPVTNLSYKMGIKSDSTSLYFPEGNTLPRELEILLSNVAALVSKYDAIHNKQSEIFAGQSKGENITYKIFSPSFTKMDQPIDLDKDGINDIQFHVYTQIDHFYRIIQMSAVGLNGTEISASSIENAQKHLMGDTITSNLNWIKGGLTLTGQTSYNFLGDFSGTGYLCFRIINKKTIYGWIYISAWASFFEPYSFNASKYAFVTRN